jgi:hypothetical protein
LFLYFCQELWLSSFFPFPGFGAQIQVLYSSENNVLLLSELTQDSHININVLKISVVAPREWHLTNYDSHEKFYNLTLLLLLL